MSWFVLALLAAFLMTLVNFGDKFLVESQVPDPLVLIILLSLFNLVMALILWSLTQFATLPLMEGFWLMVVGSAPAFAGYFYFQAVSKTETTRIVILSQLTPVFTLILSAIFLQERLTPSQLIGFVLIFVASIAVTIKRDRTKLEDITEPLWDVLLLMAITNLIYAGSLVLADYLLETQATDFSSLTLITAYAGAGYWLGGMLLLLIPQVRGAFMQRIAHIGFKPIAALSGVEAVFVLRQFMLFAAISLGPVSLISVLGSLNVFFAIGAGWLLTLWQPHIFGEDIRRATLLTKFAWAAVAFIGIWLVR